MTLAGRQDTGRGQLGSRRSVGVAPGPGPREIFREIGRALFALAGFVGWVAVALLLGA